MDCHSSTHNQYALVAETLQRLAHAIVVVHILVVEERHLHDWHVQRVLLGIEGYSNVSVSTHPNTRNIKAIIPTTKPAHTP
jgi:hypothetical protein